MTMTQDKPLTSPEYIQFVHLAADATKGDEDQLQHVFCTGCFPVPRAGIPALCGAPRPHGRPFQVITNVDDLCVVCDDLAEIPCKKCGH